MIYSSTFVAIVENGLPIRYICISPIPKNRQIFHVLGKVFLFEKNRRDLKMNIFMENLQTPSFYFENLKLEMFWNF